MRPFSDSFVIEITRKRLIEHLRANAVRTDGPFTLRSGETTDWYIDARQTTFDGAGAAAVGSSVLAVLEPSVTAVGGMTMGADPISVATAIAAHEAGRDIRSFSIRKEAKDHGTGGRLAGPVRADDRIAVVDDTTTTGGALEEAVNVVRSEGCVVVQAVALVDRSEGKVSRMMRKAGIPYMALTTPQDLGVGA